MGVVDGEFMPDAEPKAMNVSDSLLMSMSMSVAHYNPRTLPSPPGHLLNLAALWASCDVYENISSRGSVQPQMCRIWKRYISNMSESSFFSFLSFRDGELNAGSVGHRSEPHKLAGTHTAQQGLRCRVPSHFLAHQDLLFGPHLLSRLRKAQQYCKTAQFWTFGFKDMDTLSWQSKIERILVLDYLLIEIN